MADHEPMMDVACSDPELSEELREALALLRDRSDNDEFRTLVDDVLAGRCTLTEASGTAAFSDMVFARVAREFDEYVGHLTEDEKQGLGTPAHGTPAHGTPAHGTPAHDAPAQCAGAAAGSAPPCGGCAGICALAGPPR